MKNPLSDILERAETWPQSAKEDLLKAAEAIEREKVGVCKLSSEERQAVEMGLQDLKQGRFADNAELTALFEKCRG